MGTAKAKDQLAAEGVEENPGPRHGDAGDGASTSSGKEKDNETRSDSWGRGAKGGGRARPKPTCFVCGKLGHKAATCSQRGSRPSSPGMCSRCGVEGHEARYCTHSSVGDSAEEAVMSGAPLTRVIEIMDTNQRLERAAQLTERFPDLEYGDALRCCDAGLSEPPNGITLDQLLVAAGVDKPKPPPQLPAGPVDPVLGSFLTEAELSSTYATEHADGSVCEDAEACRAGGIGARRWTLAVAGAVGIALELYGFHYFALVLLILFIAAWVHVVPREHYGTEVTVEVCDVGDDGENRLRTLSHISKLSRPVRVHRYHIEHVSGEEEDLFVVDHWAAVAQSEFGYGQDTESFLKNVHLKYLRCGELDISAENYELYKRGTTEYLRRWAIGDFPLAGARGWRGTPAGDM